MKTISDTERALRAEVARLRNQRDWLMARTVELPPGATPRADSSRPAAPGLLDPILAKLEAHAVLLAAGQRVSESISQRVDELVARVAALEPSPAPPWAPTIRIASSSVVALTAAEPTLRELQAADRGGRVIEVCQPCGGLGGKPACFKCGVAAP